jgi:hypothetical protein
MEIVLIELSTIIATEGIKSYLHYRKKMIEDGREDELTTSRIKKYINNNIMSSSRDITPNRQSIDTEISLENIYEDEKEQEEKEDEENRKSITEVILRSMPIKQPQRKSLIGINTQMVKNLINRAKTPLKKIQEVEKKVVINPEFTEFMKDIMVFAIHEFESQKTEPLLLKHKQYRALLERHLANKK